MSVSFLVVFIKVMMPEFYDFPQTPIISCNLFHNAFLKLFIHPFVQEIFTSAYCVLDIVLGARDIVENETKEDPGLTELVF